MKPRRMAIALFAPFFLASIVGAVALQRHFRLLYATPETESAFLKNYTPEHVIERFREQKGFSNARHFGGEAGRTFVTHDAGFEFRVVLRRENWLPLMNTLGDDVLQQLANVGAEVLSQGGNPRDGFHFDYKISHSIGSLRISPLAIDSHIRRNMSLPEGVDDVIIKIDQRERWYPKDAGIIRVSSTNFVR